MKNSLAQVGDSPSHEAELQHELDRHFPTHTWKQLASLVADYRPDVVVLVARKMPRLADLLRLNFSARRFVISDQAIPFCHSSLKGARIAIVDDVINVGTTMANAAEQLRACGAARTQGFALRARSAEWHSNLAPDLDVKLVDYSPMSEETYREFVRRVPRSLQLLPKPYDTDLPIVHCEVRPSLNSYHAIWEWFKHKFGENAVLQTTDLEMAHGLLRISVDHEAPTGANFKTRYYFDLKRGLCNVVPMAIPSIFAGVFEAPADGWPGYLWSKLNGVLKNRPIGSSTFPMEPIVRAELFCRSLEFAPRVLEQVSGAMNRSSSEPFSVQDACLVFGPAVAEFVDSAPALDVAPRAATVPFTLQDQSRVTPDETSIHLEGSEAYLLADIDTCLDKELFGLAFQRLFTNLSLAVGADDPSTYKLTGPYTRDEIVEAPYKRLRIGYPFGEVIKILARRQRSQTYSFDEIKSTVSRLMDQYIDAGALVPTFLFKGNLAQRVYRKGEHDFSDPRIERLQYAWSSSEKPMSLTRFAKITAILSYSSAVRAEIVPDVRERGVIGSLPETVLSRSTISVAQYLRRAGALTKPDGKDAEGE